MRCYNCGAELGKGDNCQNCGTNVKVYKKILMASNAYYNDALEKAGVRDLSGAIESLKISLRFNKLNIDARNLLGLIYYEMGEVVTALTEWVISKCRRIRQDWILSIRRSRNTIRHCFTASRTAVILQSFS